MENMQNNLLPRPPLWAVRHSGMHSKAEVQQKRQHNQIRFPRKGHVSCAGSAKDEPCPDPVSRDRLASPKRYPDFCPGELACSISFAVDGTEELSCELCERRR